MHLCRLVFPCFVGIYLRTSVILHGLISFRNSSRLPWQLSVRFYSMARSRYISPEKWGGSEFACFVRLSIVFFECYFKPFLYVFWTSKSQKIWGEGLRPLSPHQGPAMDLLRGLQLPGASRPPAALHYARFMHI